jgi:hypothetical protein
LKYCGDGQNERIGVIDFAVSSPVTGAFKDAVRDVDEADWQPLRRHRKGKLVEPNQQWAEICFVPKQNAAKQNGPVYGFIAIGEALKQLCLPGLDLKTQPELPFATIDDGEPTQPNVYKLFAVVTHRDIHGEGLIWRHRERFGKSQEVHAVMRHDLAGGTLRSKRFGANAAWWASMILALNLPTLLRRLVLGEGWFKKRMKSIRYGFINLPGPSVQHGRRLILRLGTTHLSTQFLLDARTAITPLAHAPPT